MLINHAMFWLMFAEATVCLVLSLPIGKSVSVPVVRFLSSRFGGQDSTMASVSKVAMALVTVLFLSDVHTVYKYHSPETYLSDGLRLRLVTAQRDMYISGFCLFLFLLLRQVYHAMASNLSLEKSLHAMQKQAEGASKGYKTLLEEQETLKHQRDKLQTLLGVADSADGASSLAKLLDENAALSKQLEASKAACKSAESQVEAVKKQAEGQSNAYMKLMAEQQSLDDVTKRSTALEEQVAKLQKELKDVQADRDSLKQQVQDYDFMFTEAKKKAE